MHDQDLNIPAYLERIGFAGDPVVNAETLKLLHRGHTLNIPFENLNVFYKKGITLDTTGVFKKIVVSRRGGYCFEMNSLFAAVLAKLGFGVSNHLARVYHEGFELTGKTHHVLTVKINGEDWLCDVGFGGSGLVDPVLLAPGHETEQFYRRYRIETDSRYGYVLLYETEGAFVPMYAFTQDPCFPSDYAVANHFTETHPASLFVNALICTKPTPEGRITLMNRQLKIADREGTREVTLETEAQLTRVLRDYFDL